MMQTPTLAPQAIIPPVIKTKRDTKMISGKQCIAVHDITFDLGDDGDGAMMSYFVPMIEVLGKEHMIEQQKLEEQRNANRAPKQLTPLDESPPSCAICHVGIWAYVDRDSGDDVNLPRECIKCHQSCHNVCISQWLSINPSCPSCRAVFQGRYDFL